MPWLRIDDGMVEHLKVASLSDAAFRVHVEALSFCARNLTDGHIPEAIAKNRGWSRKARELIRAGLWHAVEGGHEIHDYLEYNPSREQVEAERKAARERMNRLRSPDVRANKRRTPPERSPEVRGGVRQKFNDPDPDPDVPTEHSGARTRAMRSESGTGRPPGMPGLDDVAGTGAA